ncbi:uncharacterized protein LOC118208867 isoform X1 [Anguilla anguilla]|uniref:uncharacterized protein LOC118208867 isoform X1 n=1 Tax=Anguilla anguilla TaxID=7936 RepID=UPI0015B064FA|nr:uncharacterized protein LOC118208867 isoform X1 [Anguilla anguilla]
MAQRQQPEQSGRAHSTENINTQILHAIQAITQNNSPQAAENIPNVFINPNLLQLVNNINHDTNDMHEMAGDYFERLNEALANLTAGDGALTPAADSLGFLNDALERLNQEGGNLNESPLTPTSDNPQGSDDVHAAAANSNDDDDGVVTCGPDMVVVQRPSFNCVEIRQRFNFASLHDVDSYEDFYNVLLNLLDHVLYRAMQLARPNDVLQLELRGDTLSEGVSIIANGASVDLDTFLGMVGDLVQSNFEILSDDTLELVVQIVQNPNGGVRRKIATCLRNEILRKKLRHLFVSHNVENNLCFAICLSQMLNPEFTLERVEQDAVHLQTSVGLGVQDMVSFSDIQKFEQLLKVKIVVWYRNAQNVFCKFQTNPEPHPKTVFLYLENEHYFGIKSLKGFLGSAYVCAYCYTPFTAKANHHCKYYCNVCFSAECSSHPLKSVKCKDCRRICRSAFCYTAHKVTKMNNATCKMSAPCDTHKYCEQCGRMYIISSKKPVPHRCSVRRCVNCNDELVADSRHACYIQQVKPEQPSERYVFYDFECRQDDGVHVANFICCIDFNGVRWTAAGDGCVEAFTRRFRTPKYKGYTFIAHNSKGYDGYLIMQHLIKQGVTPSIIAQGSKLLCITDDAFEQRYIDSLSFLTMKLSAMPSALGFENVKKGYFPHFWNTVANQNYTGPYPPPLYYGSNTMSEKERSEFMQWYATVSGRVFDFRKEMSEYCINDVVILREGCLRFRREVLSCTGLDPFQGVTIASVCMKQFCTSFLPKDTLAITTPDNYILKQKSFSTPAIQWLEYLSHRDNVFIQHALNRGEVKFGPYFLDGYSEVGGVRTAFEFHGCLFHGCPQCFDSNTINPLTKQDFGSMYRKSQEKIDILRSTYNLHVVVLWEHEWVRLKKESPEVQTFLLCSDYPERLEPRDALFGGRTNALRLKYKVQEDEQIHYYDFTSLYPFVNKTKVYPTDHPTIIFRDFEPIENYFGLIKAKIYPPRDLYLPVLPYRVSGKLMFPLCRSCAVSEHQGKCVHSDEERSLTGVWCSIELAKAVEKGYQVAKIFEVWHFPQRSDSLFSGYINTHLKGKQEASGYPSWVSNDLDKDRYMQSYLEKEGIHLDPSKICVNKAKRQISKLFLNSLWGKFGQRTNQVNTALIHDPEQFLLYMFSKEYEISHFSFITEDVALVQWRYAKGFSKPPKYSNVLIAAFTTAYARLELYNLMDKLPDRVLYHDTDSVIFVSRPGDWVPPLGDFLGELTSELDTGDHIVEFVSGGPKTYAYRTRGGKTCMKVKGITLHHTNTQVVNLSSLTDLVDHYVSHKNDPAKEVATTTQQIVRDKKAFILRNRTVSKRFRVVYNKRVLLPDFQTLPYGY